MKDEAIACKVAASLRLDASAVQVELYPLLGRAVVALPEITAAVQERNRYANVESGWDIELVTPDMLPKIQARALASFATLPDVSRELAEALVEQGLFSYEDLAVIDPDELARLSGFAEAQVDGLIWAAEDAAQREEFRRSNSPDDHRPQFLRERDV
ncbi:MAG: helix-hairpin-helix domain-containing protein [Pirellulales bacterium]